MFSLSLSDRFSRALSYLIRNDQTWGNMYLPLFLSPFHLSTSLSSSPLSSLSSIQRFHNLQLEVNSIRPHFSLLCGSLVRLLLL